MRIYQKNAINFFKVLSILLLFSCKSKEVSKEITSKSNKYNVLFIAIDDLRPELNCYGANHIKSPNIDRLASNGVLFKQAHVQQAICMASRASILTGLRPETNGIYTGGSVTDLLPNITTLNKYFKNNDYSIAACGKVYHSGKDAKEQFGGDNMIAKATWTARGYVTDEAIEKIALNTDYHRGPAYEIANVHDTIYEDGLNTLNAVRKLEQFKNEDRPFFLAVGLKKPHLPFNAPKKYWDMYPEQDITMPEITQRPENSNDYTMRRRGELSNYYNMPYSFEEISDSTAIKLRRAYYACVSYADAQVGKLLDELDRLDLRENTIIVLWGDHGYKLGDYNSWCKWSNMNIDTNIPLIFNVPGGIKGESSNVLVEALDIYPTLTDLCGLETPNHVMGKSLSSLLKNPIPNKEEEKYVYTLWPISRDNYNKTVMGYSVKTSQFNYVEWVKLSTGEVLERELYDHRVDIKETKNVVADSDYEKNIIQLAKKLQIRKDETTHNFTNTKL